jgi:hypothetical protein
MRAIKTVTAAIAVVSTLTMGIATARGQQSGHEHDASKQPPAAEASTPAAPAHGMGAHTAQHMEMCRQMMAHGGGMPGMPMPGMPMMGTSAMSGDPAQQANMLAMRGEMMKAMGDIMLKYARRARTTTK